MPANHLKIFENNISELDKLIKAPHIIRDIVYKALSSFDENNLTNLGRNSFSNFKMTVKNISDSSLENSYKLIYNQVCIFAVSSISSLLENYFSNLINTKFRDIDFSENKIKLELREAANYDFNLRAYIGEIILNKDNSINFQNLDSTLRSFKKYLHKNIELDPAKEKVIRFYLQCRHSLVHQSGYIDNEFIDSTTDCNIKDYSLGDRIQLDESDWIKIKEVFTYYLQKVIESIIEELDTE